MVPHERGKNTAVQKSEVSIRVSRYLYTVFRLGKFPSSQSVSPVEVTRDVKEAVVSYNTVRNVRMVVLVINLKNEIIRKIIFSVVQKRKRCLREDQIRSPNDE